MVVEDSGARLGLVDASARSEMPDGAEWLGVDHSFLESVVAQWSTAPISDLERGHGIRPDNAAYMIFTSGSTGRPKGVMVTHSGLRNVATGLRDEHRSNSSSRWLGVSSPAFDASMMEVLGAYVEGGTMVVAPADTYGGPELARFIREHDVTHAFLVPSVAASMPTFGDGALADLLLGGEAVPASEIARWTAADSSRALYNVYGPTETTIIAVTSAAMRGQPITIGDALPGVHTLILDQWLRPVPTGVAGELYLAGPALARGYAHHGGLTAERFVADPYDAPGSRMYRTGDLVRWRSDDTIEYLGRSDFQVKVRGLRIEMGEIESALRRVDGVAAAVVTAVERPAGTALAAYVVPAEGARPDRRTILADLGRLLPAYMVPASLTILDRMPLGPIGKLDRRALPEPEFTATETVAPRTPAEKAIAAVFGEVLGIAEVSVIESFFDMGGNSLSATRVVGRLGDLVGDRVGVRTLFDHPTVESLAGHLDHTRTRPSAPIVVGRRPDRVPLSLAQQRMWFINQLDPASSAYNIPTVLRLTGDLDVEALRAALDDVITRHEVLRTIYPATSGDPAQQIIDARTAADDLDWAVVGDLDSVVASATDGFDVTTDLPVRVRLLDESPSGDEPRHLLSVVVHHIAADGESMAPLVRDLIVAYDARHAGRRPDWQPLPLQFADVAVWQREMFGAADDPTSLLHRQLRYWADQLAGLPDVVALPADRIRPAVASHIGDNVDFEIPADTARRITEVARTFGVTPFMVVHAGLAALVARLSDTDDIAIGTPVAGRGRPEFDDLVGMFVNTLVLRTRVEQQLSFADLVAQVRAVDLEAFSHSEVPFESIVDELNPTRSQAFAPLTQIMLTFEQAAMPELAGGDLPADEVADLRVTPLPPIEYPAKLDLTVGVSVAEADSPWRGSLIYATDLFDESTVVTFARRLVAMIDTLTRDPQAAIGDIPIYIDGEIDQVVAASVGARVEVEPVTLTDRVDRQIAATPDAVALVFGETEMTYGEFGTRVTALARALIDRGVGAETAVGVAIPRSVELLVAVHAVVAAGGHYVPVDTDAPVERVRYMLETADVELVIVAAETCADSVATAGVEVYPIECTGPVPQGPASPISDADRPQTLRPDSAAYTLFTSGSTGRPKGVTVSHHAIVNRLEWMQSRFPLTGDDVVLQKTPVTFDVSVWELFWPLMVGARLVIARPDGHRDPRYLVAVMSEQAVSTVHFVPSMLSAFVDVVGAEAMAGLTSLRQVFTSGEALGSSVSRSALSTLPNAAVHNLYGPTEAAVDVTHHEVRASDKAVPIGVPIWNTTTYVLDRRLRPVPVGVVGELYLGGVQIARGYAARADLTADRFVANPFGAHPFGNPGERLYRTGDLVRWNRAGELEYLGRGDFQVKLRGQRIELGEIEAALAAAPGVVHAAATVVDLRGDQRLVGYVSGGDPRAGLASVDLNAVKEFVAHRLPKYMCPSTWMVVDTMPLSTAGKIDRSRLPSPVFEAAEYVAPSGETETLVAQTVASVLGTDRVGATESFFDLGGNSLSAVRVIAALREVTGRDIELAWLFADPTVRGLAQRLAAGPQMESASADIVIGLRAEGRGAPLFCIHPAGGLAWLYGGLATHLPGRPIYGVQDPHVVAGETAASSITEMARRYVEEIRSIRGEGPYHLLGWSLGGVIAHEMAVILEAEGAEVGVVALMDAMVSSQITDDMASNAPDAADLLGAWRVLFDLDPAPTEGSGDRDVRSDDIAALIREQLGASGLVGDDQIDRIMDSFRLSEAVMAEHRPRVFGGDLTVFTATADKAEPAMISDSWRPLAAEVTNVDVDTAHLGMAGASALAVIGPRLSVALDDAEDDM
jgi:amino acid adenylation domain-containing protein